MESHGHMLAVSRPRCTGAGDICVSWCVYSILPTHIMFTCPGVFAHPQAKVSTPVPCGRLPCPASGLCMGATHMFLMLSLMSRPRGSPTSFRPWVTFRGALPAAHAFSVVSGQ